MSRAATPVALAFFASTLALLAGCAAPGDPSPRHPVVPVPITDLAARQMGDTVVLTFALPTRSMDREALAESPSIEIYRAAIPPGTNPNRKVPWRLVYTIPSERDDSYLKQGHVEFQDRLAPSDLANASGNALAYTVRTREVKTRASGDSNVVTVHVYPPPEAPHDLHTVVTEPAIVVSWAEPSALAGPSSISYRVYRAEIEPGDGSSQQDLSQVKFKSPPELAGPSSSATFQDSHFEFGKTYLYTVRSVALFGADSVESADSSPASITPRDVFPPAAPLGLEIAIVLATSQAPAYVELSWAISPEADLAGYDVYRSDREDTPGDRMNGEILLSPTFRDISVMPGKQYFYRVSAVDHAGNKSPKSSAVQIAVP